MKILFLTDNFPPEVNAPASRTYEHCRVWAAQGHDVTVITCAPNFPTGKVHDGYRNALYSTEEVSGIRVIRVWTFISSNEGFLMRILDYVSFMLSAIIASLFVRKPDIIIGTSPQFFTICAARVVAKLRRRPWILELRDIWPESIMTVGAMKRGLAIRFLEWLERSLYRSADYIVVVTRSFVDLIVAKGARRADISVVTNGVDLSGVARRNTSELRRDLNLEDMFVAGYIGTHGMAHSLETIIEAAALAQSRKDCSDVRFLFVGDGARKSDLQDLVREQHLSNVIFVPTVPKDQVLLYLSLIDASIVHLRKSDLFQTVIPSKIFESMALGVPILMGVKGEALEIVESAGAGISFEPEDAGSLIRAITALKDNPTLRSDMAKAGNRAAQKFDRSQLALAMLETVRKVADKA